MRSSRTWYKLMTVLAGSSVMLAWGCNLSLASAAFTAGFFGLLGMEALAAPQILLGLGQFLPFVTGQ